jgi:hypothetical protein
MTEKDVHEQTFRKIVKTLRTKRAAAGIEFRMVSKKLMKSIELEPKEVILGFAEAEYVLQQQYSILNTGVHCAERILANFGRFMSEECPENLEKDYGQLLGINAGISSVKDLFGFRNIRNPKEEIVDVEIHALKESRPGQYVKKYAQEKGSCQGALERLRILFPAPRGRLQKRR